MNSFFKKRIFTPFSVLIVIIVAAGCAFGASVIVNQKNETAKTTELSTSQMYESAVADAVKADTDETESLVTLTKDEPLITWNEAGDRVLMLSFHKYPDSYINGSDITLKYGDVWTFTDREIVKWYKQNGADVKDWTQRLEQLIGLPENSNYTHISALWVNPADIVRPAYNPDPTVNSMSNELSENTDSSFTQWFDGNIIHSYFDSSYPWTRLGYTYDWSDKTGDRGLTEFLVLKGSNTTVEFTKSTDEFISWLSEQ